MKTEILYEKMLDALIPTLLRTTKLSAGGRWPMPILKQSNFVSFYSSPWIIRDFMQLTDKLLKDGWTYEQIGKKYVYPSQLARLMHLFPSRSLWFMGENEYINVGYRLANILSTMYRKDLFCENGKYIVFDDSTLKNKFKISIKKIDEIILNYPSIKYLGGLMWLLAESFGPRYTNVFYEFSGPYKFWKYFLVVKEFHNLRLEHLPIKFYYDFSNLTLIEIYKHRPYVKFDIMNRVISKGKDASKFGFLLYIDGKNITNEIIIKKYVGQIERTLQESVNYLQSKTTKHDVVLLNALAEKHALIYPLQGKEAFNLSPDFINAIDDPSEEKKRKPVFEWFNRVPKDAKGWRQLFDLRLIPKL